MVPFAKFDALDEGLCARTLLMHCVHIRRTFGCIAAGHMHYGIDIVTETGVQTLIQLGQMVAYRSISTAA